MNEISWFKLPNDEYGVSGSQPAPAKGEIVTVRAKSGREQKVAIKDVWADGKFWRASIVRDETRPAGGNMAAKVPITPPKVVEALACPHCGVAIKLGKA